MNTKSKLVPVVPETPEEINAAESLVAQKADECFVIAHGGSFQNGVYISPIDYK